MLKFIGTFLLSVVIAVAVVASVPAMRRRVLPPLARALGPSAMAWKAQYECKTLVLELRTDLLAGRVTRTDPLAYEDFPAWARRKLRDSEAGTDPWGSPYYSSFGLERIIVASPGPDRKRDTADDIVVVVPRD